MMTILEELKPQPDFDKFIAPNLLECEFAKKVAALQAFTNPEEGEKFHVLLVGSPSSGKSDILKYMIKMCPNSGYVGQRTTKAGLEVEFAYVDTGILGVEEFDKLNRDIHRYLLEMMEDQQVKITTKWGREIVKARTNLFAVCNPRNQILNDMEPVHLQLTFSENITLLSRFALIIPFYALGGERYGDIAVSGNIDTDDEQEKQRAIMKYLIKVRRLIPKIYISDEMARMAGDYIGGELKKYSPMGDILTPRSVKMGFLTALRARARMNFRKSGPVEIGGRVIYGPSPSMQDFDYIKKIFENAYGPSGGIRR